MAEQKPQRGRPKGSGIDDRTRLAAIAALIAANPELKPTTAIKSIGITDPSIIRRLRDKFHAAQSELMADLHDTAPAAIVEPAMCAAIPAAISEPAVAPQRAMAAQIAAPVRKAPSASVPEIPAAPPAPTVAAAEKSPVAHDETPDWLTAFCGFGITAASTAFQAQLVLAQQLIRLPQVALALRQHVAFNELTMAMVQPHLRHRQGLH